MFKNEQCYKIYGKQGLIDRQEDQLQLLNEYSVTVIAKKSEMTNLIQLERLVGCDD